MLRKKRYWIILLAISVLGVMVLEFHIRHWDFWASFCAFIDVFLLGIFIRETIRKEIRAALTEWSNR